MNLTADEVEEMAQLAALLEDPWCNPTHPDFDPADRRWRDMPMDVKGGFLAAAERYTVLRQGWTGRFVFPTADSPDDAFPFAYTIGLDPAVIITGPLPSDAMGSGFLAIAVEHSGIPTGAPWRITDDYEAVWAPVPDAAFRETCTGAVAKGAGSARQFLWMDEQHRWPWDPESRYHGVVPVLAGDDWRPTEPVTDGPAQEPSPHSTGG